VGPRGSLDAVAKGKIPSHCQESNCGRSFRSLITILTELPWLPYILIILFPKACSVFFLQSKKILTTLGRSQKCVIYHGFQCFGKFYRTLLFSQKQLIAQKVDTALFRTFV
jgi:hypothetical protein